MIHTTLTETNYIVQPAIYVDYQASNIPIQILAHHLVVLYAKLIYGLTIEYFIVILQITFYIIKSRWVLTTLVGLGCR